MQCGEKDPFVDDTIIFAGRVREAKRQRKHELREMLNKTSVPSQNVQLEWQKELEKLNGESEGDWVQMQIFSDWSHGYLQMPALMKEAGAAINDLADWINDAFNTLGSTPSTSGAMAANGAVEVNSGAGALSSGESSSTVHTVAVTGLDEPNGLWRFWPWTKRQHQQEQGHDVKVRIEGENDHLGPHESVTAHADHLQPSAYPTTATDTETENDEGITFIPKTTRRASDVTVTGTRRARFSRGSHDAARDDPVLESPPLIELPPAWERSPPLPQSQSKKSLSRENSPERITTESFTTSTPPRPSALPISLRRASQGATAATRPAATVLQGLSPPSSAKLTASEEGGGGERKGRDRTRSPETTKRRSATPGTGVGGKTGTPVPNARQTITETELMRRRRLLDSHIFESE